MFARRSPLPLAKRFLLWIWPERGWRRQSAYIAHRIKRLPGTPSRIAAGFACGVAVSFTPFVGFHFVLAAFLALIMRGNIIASAIGTAMGNPWTFPFIWLWTYNIGLWLLSREPLDMHGSMTMNFIFDNPLLVLWPMTVGSLPTLIVAWLVAFIPMRIAVRRYQIRRRRRLRRRIERKRMRDLLKLGPKGSGSPSGNAKLAAPVPEATPPIAPDVEKVTVVLENPPAEKKPSEEMP